MKPGSVKEKMEAREKRIKSSESINREKGRLEEAKHMNNRVLRRVFNRKRKKLIYFFSASLLACEKNIYLFILLGHNKDYLSITSQSSYLRVIP
jgi:hypothetical protein